MMTVVMLPYICGAMHDVTPLYCACIYVVMGDSGRFCGCLE